MRSFPPSTAAAVLIVGHLRSDELRHVVLEAENPAVGLGRAPPMVPTVSFGCAAAPRLPGKDRATLWEQGSKGCLVAGWTAGR